MSVLSARDGYRLWAPAYPRETAVTLLEAEVFRPLSVDTVGRRLLDVGCGDGARSATAEAALVVGVDLSPEMLGRSRAGGRLVASDARALAIADAAFDVVWCRLVIGYAREIGQVYGELARVCRPDGWLVVTDLHADAVRAGHRRTFRDARGELHEIRQHRHTPQAHRAAAARVGLVPERSGEGVVGESLRAAYAAAGRLAMYEAQRGQRLVWGQSYRRAS